MWQQEGNWDILADGGEARTDIDNAQPDDVRIVPKRIFGRFAGNVRMIELTARASDPQILKFFFPGWPKTIF